ncbi:MAG: exopolysaccharide biosynthesis protein [Verrucomicrobiota bacterium]|nr:exopolysaccharide biosynthesis protein [Verrucomicrobiota bacterium]
MPALPEEVHDLRPLSQTLDEISLEWSASGGVTLNQIIERTERRGLYFVLILLSLPFSTPIPLPGLSNIFGFAMLLLSIRLAFGMPPYLPRFIGSRSIPADKMCRIIKVSIKLLRFLEKIVKPRRTQWMNQPPFHCFNSLLIGLMAFVLMLPIPPVIPFSNALPSYAIILLAMSMMEEDGFMIWGGYLMTTVTLGYIISTAGLIVKAIVKYSDDVLRWFQNMF